MKRRLSSIVLAVLMFVSMPLLMATAADEQPQRGAIKCTEIIAPKYEDAKFFSEDFAPVKKDGKWGYIDEGDNTVIDFKYDYAGTFDEGKAIVGVITGSFAANGATYERYKLGFIDRSGNETWFARSVEGQSGVSETPLVQCAVKGSEPENIGTFYQGYIVLAHDENAASQTEFCLFDSTGREVIPQDGENKLEVGGWWVTENKVITEGAAGVVYYNVSTGKVTKASAYTELRPYNQGIAPAGVRQTVEGEDGYVRGEFWSFIDEDGAVKIDGKFSDFMVIDTDGEYKVFGENALACVADGEGYWGAINKDGKWVIPAQYEALYPFSCGLAACRTYDSFGFIDMSGKWVIPAKYDMVSSFSDKGYAAAYDGKKVFLIDKNGAEIKGSGKLDKDTYFTENADSGIPTVRAPLSIAVIKENGKYGFMKIDYLPELPNGEGMSSWALTEVREAVKNELVPEYMQCLYKTDINRKDFCSLVVRTVSAITGMDIGDYVEEKTGKDVYEVMTSYPFYDTVDYDVIAANALGIVNGRGNGVFDPYSGISRQEAAVMLTNAAAVLGFDVSDAPELTLADGGDISSWAAKEVNFVYSIGVMNGVGQNRFNPTGKYTREQSYLTAYRLFQAADGK